MQATLPLPIEDYKPRVMLVDDNRDFLQSTEAILQTLAGYQVITLDDPCQALDTARREKPDVIVLDVYMPGMNGPQVCRELKNAPELRHVPVLFLTAVGTEEHFRACCLEEGADDFLQKPVGSEELIARLRVLLRIKFLQDELRRERDELELKVQERARELKRTETLAAIGKMMAGVAHEIRNPLGAISNSATVLARDLVLEGDDRKLMEIIVREANRLRDTINEFLTFAHPPPYNFTAVDLQRVMEEVLYLARRDSLCSVQTKLTLDVPADLPPVQVDRDRLQQILWNLIRNALEATKGKVNAFLSARLETSENIPGVILSIADDGPGIPPQDRELIFEPFFTRKARGSGLGLALVQSSVNAHNGKIWLQIEDEIPGSKFLIWLPLKQENGLCNKDIH
jgi:signal transduction histidine kinase